MGMNTILVLMTLGLLLALPASASDFTLDIFGNANEDETINMQDVTYTELIILEYRDRTELADAKYDGKINMQDVTQIELVILGKELEMTLIDDTGEAVTVHKPIESFVYHGHNAYVYETMRAIDAADKIVGISDRFVTPGKARYSENYYPELVTGCTNIGLLNSPDYEVVNTLRPDVVLSDEERYYDRTKTPDIPVIAMDVRMGQFTESTMKYGYIFDKRDVAEEYIDWRNGWVSTISERTDGLTDDEQPLVFGAYPQADFTSFWIWGGNSPEGPPLVLAGGNNIGQELEPMWPQVDREWIIARNPSVTILATPVTISGYDIDDPSEVAAVREQFSNLPEFAGIDAVKNEEVYVINYAHFMVGGASCLLATAYFAKWFHPDLFEDLDPQAIQQEYVTRFQHLDFNVAEHGVFVYPPMQDS